MFVFVSIDRAKALQAEKEVEVFNLLCFEMVLNIPLKTVKLFVTSPPPGCPADGGRAGVGALLLPAGG